VYCGRPALSRSTVTCADNADNPDSIVSGRPASPVKLSEYFVANVPLKEIRYVSNRRGKLSSKCDSPPAGQNDEENKRSPPARPVLIISTQVRTYLRSITRFLPSLIIYPGNGLVLRRRYRSGDSFLYIRARARSKYAG